MKKFITLLSVILCCSTSANANLCHEKEYWIEEINKKAALSDNDTKLRNCFIFGSIDTKIDHLEPEIPVLERSIITVADVLKENLAEAELVSINFYRTSPQSQQIITKHILNALISNSTAKRLFLSRLDNESAKLLAKIIERNNTIIELEANESGFNDEAAEVIAAALSKNSTLQKLEMQNSKFSMTARKKIRIAWEKNKVANRKQEIEF